MSSCVRNIAHFLVFVFMRCCAVSKSAQFRTHCPPSSAAAVMICPARSVLYRVQTGAACPAFGRVCRCSSCCGRSALHLARPVLPPVMCRPSGCAGGCRGTPEGYTAAAQPRPVSPVTTEKIKKAQKTTPTPISNLKNSAAKTKRPLQRVCVLCYTCLTSLEREESVK